jgi:hypothetical protein
MTIMNKENHINSQAIKIDKHLNEILHTIEKNLPENLINPGSWEKIKEMGNRLSHLFVPPVILFESRFETDDNTVDVIPYISSLDKSRNIIAETPFSQNAWNGLKQICREWTTPNSILNKKLQVIQLEFDAMNQIENLPEPSIWIGRMDFPDSYVLGEKCIGILQDQSFLKGVKWPVKEIFEKMPASWQIVWLGMMIAREPNKVRVAINCKNNRKIWDFVDKFDFKLEKKEFLLLDRIINKTLQEIKDIAIGIQINIDARQELGIELNTREAGTATPAWKQLFEIVASELEIDRKKVKDFRNWQGPLEYLEKRLSHIKLNYRPGKKLQVKGYFGIVTNAYIQLRKQELEDTVKKIR